MKKTTQKIAVLTVTMFTLLTTAQAQTTPQLTKVSNVNNQPTFELRLNNELNDRYTIVIKDLWGIVLYEEKISEVKAVRKFALDADAFSAASTLHFDVRNNTNKTATHFEIKNNTKPVDEIVVVSR